jgi:hypothetical protein
VGILSNDRSSSARNSVSRNTDVVFSVEFLLGTTMAEYCQPFNPLRVWTVSRLSVEIRMGKPNKRRWYTCSLDGTFSCAYVLPLSSLRACWTRRWFYRRVTRVRLATPTRSTKQRIVYRSIKGCATVGITCPALAQSSSDEYRPHTWLHQQHC